MLLTSKSQDRIIVEAIFGKGHFRESLYIPMFSVPTNSDAPFQIWMMEHRD